MPKTKLGDRVKAMDSIAKIVRMYLAADEMTVKECGGKAGIYFTTLYRRLKRPDDLTIGELIALKKTLGIPEDDSIEAIRARLAA